MALINRELDSTLPRSTLTLFKIVTTIVAKKIMDYFIRKENCHGNSIVSEQVSSCTQKPADAPPQ